MPEHLQKRANRWYAVMEIPRKLRPQFGRDRFIESLKTEDRSIAETKLYPKLAEWKARIDGIDAGETIDWVTRNGVYSMPVTPPEVLFARLRQAATPEERAAILEEIDEMAGHVGAIYADLGKLPSSAPEARRYAAVATGNAVGFAAQLDEWQATTTRLAPQTRAMQRADVERFAAKFPTVQEVTRPEVQRWANGLLADDLTASTLRRNLSSLRRYWRHLQSAGVATEDNEPFNKIELGRQSGRGTTDDKRRAFTPPEVVKLFHAAMGDLADLIRLGMWTGARIEELCSLRVENVAAGHFTVTAGKSHAALRDIPIHAELAQTMTRLIDGRTTGYVLVGLGEPDKKRGNRSTAIGQRFGRLKTAEGFGPTHVFHSIRKCVATLFENAGVAENVAADILGHEKPTMTYGLYSGGASLALKAEAIAKLAY